MPSSIGDRASWERFSDDEVTTAEALSSGFQEAVTIEDYLASSSDADAEVVSRILSHLRGKWHDQNYLPPSDFYDFLEIWRDDIVSACVVVEAGMAKTAAEARLQNVVPPRDAKDWVEYALTMDGEAIAEELDYFVPGDFDVEFELDSPEHGVFDLRMDLYCKLRYLQRQYDNELFEDPDDELLEEIQRVLDCIRRKRRVTSGNDDAGDEDEPQP